MEIKGFNGNLSAYLADLVRRDKERFEAQSKQGGTGDTQMVNAALDKAIGEKESTATKL